MWFVPVRAQFKYGALFGIFFTLTATVGIVAGVFGAIAATWVYTAGRSLVHASTRSAWKDAADEIAELLDSRSDGAETSLELEERADGSGWIGVARDTGLELVGEIEGRPARIRATDEAGSRRTTWEIDCTDFLPDWLDLRPARVEASADWWVQTGDVKVGHEELDRRFMVGGAEAEKVRAFFWEHELGDDFAEVFDAAGSFEIADGVIRDMQEGVVRRSQALRNQAARLRTVADRLEQVVSGEPRKTTLPNESLDVESRSNGEQERRTGEVDLDECREDAAVHQYD